MDTNTAPDSLSDHAPCLDIVGLGDFAPEGNSWRSKDGVLTGRRDPSSFKRPIETLVPSCQLCQRMPALCYVPPGILVSQVVI